MKSLNTITSVTCAMIIASTATAGSHSWRINEVFSNADGTIQFIELHEAFGMSREIFMAGLRVTSLSTGNFFTFPAQLVGPTTDHYLLLATQTFADLPNAPTPDYIIPQHFFNPNGDTLTYNMGIYDTWTIPAGAIPTDCVQSFHRNFGGTPGPGLNSPTNYAFESDGVDACPSLPADLDGNGVVNTLDLGILLSAWTIPPALICPSPCPADIDGNGVVNTLDLGILLSSWTL